MAQWLANNFEGALDYTNPRFALFGAMNWMRALSIRAEALEASSDWAASMYLGLNPASFSDVGKARIIEQLTFAVQSVAGLMALDEDVGRKADVARIGIEAWQDAILCSARAMCMAAEEGDFDGDGLPLVWQAKLVEVGLVADPFSFYVKDLTRDSVSTTLDELRQGSRSDLNSIPVGMNQALGALVSYLAGTCDYASGSAEEEVRQSRQYIDSGFDSFRKKAARELRDETLRERSVCFLDEVVRYHGKSKARDCIFLSYGHDNSAQLSQFFTDLVMVAQAFFKMARGYCEARLPSDYWQEFATDLTAHSRLSLQFEFK